MEPSAGPPRADRDLYELRGPGDWSRRSDVAELHCGDPAHVVGELGLERLQGRPLLIRAGSAGHDGLHGRHDVRCETSQGRHQVHHQREIVVMDTSISQTRTASDAWT